MINNIFTKKNQKKLFFIQNIKYFFIILLLYLLSIFNIKIEKRSFYKKKIVIKNELILEKYKRTSILWPLPKEIKYRPLMTKREIKAFSFFMKPGNIYFEFGSGGSTNIASYYNITTFSVDSDIKWHRQLKYNKINAKYITIDLKAKRLGYPGEGTTVKDWKKYIQAYKKDYNADIILIDGRFRVACGLDIFNKIRNDTIVLIHNYKKRRNYYILEKYYLKLKQWDSLFAFIKRPNISFIPEKIYNKYLKIYKL